MPHLAYGAINFEYKLIDLQEANFCIIFLGVHFEILFQVIDFEIPEFGGLIEWKEGFVKHGAFCFVMDHGDELLSIDSILVACIFEQQGRYFLLCGFATQLLLQFLLEDVSRDVSIGVECPPVYGLHNIFPSLVYFSQFAFDFSLWDIILLGVGVQILMIEAIFLFVQFPKLKIGSRTSGIISVEGILLAMGDGFVN